MTEVKIVNGVRTFIIKKEAEAVKPVPKAQLERERKAKTGRGNARIRNAVRKPSPVIVTTYTKDEQ